MRHAHQRRRPVVHDHPLLAAAISSETASVRSVWADHVALRRIQQSVAGAPIRFLLWDGFELPAAAQPIVGSIRFRNRGALFSWVWDPDLNFGETYMSGAVEISGNLVALLESIYRAFPAAKPRSWWLWQSSNDLDVAKENVHHHYDLGNDFYAAWLDREMVYTCAY